MVTDRHIMRHAGGEVIIENGEVVDATEPLVEWCPLKKMVYGRDTPHTKEFIKEIVRYKIEKVGMFTKDRIVESDSDLVPYGASEMLMCAKQHGIIDCAVLACDGAGTVIATTPRLIQGIGEWMGGLIATSPIREVIERIERAGGTVVDPDNAGIDQLRGVGEAFELGFRRVAVTVAGRFAERLLEFRRLEAERDGALIILMICNTGVEAAGAELMAAHADLVWACASKAVWDVVGPRAIIQIGIGIPVFVLTDPGKEIVEKRADAINRREALLTENLPCMVSHCYPRPLL
jgi:putative methanogenesis marker protein 8